MNRTESKVRRRILVPLDGSAFSAAAMPVARWLAHRLHADVVLLAVGSVAETEEQAVEERRQLQIILDGGQRALAGVTVHERADTRGDPTRCILDAIADEDIDLVVMSTHGREGISEIACGSTAKEVVRAAHVPVTLIRPGQPCRRPTAGTR